MSWTRITFSDGATIIRGPKGQRMMVSHYGQTITEEELQALVDGLNDLEENRRMIEDMAKRHGEREGTVPATPVADQADREG